MNFMILLSDDEKDTSYVHYNFMIIDQNSPRLKSGATEIEFTNCHMHVPVACITSVERQCAHMQKTRRRMRRAIKASEHQYLSS